MAGNGHVLSVPPGFRFHPTDEELLYYYLRKKVSYEPIDLDVITEVDLNKLEPWDLKDKCRIGSVPQNEWYFFSHKDKKYPTGTRTNRATAVGFWKATGRDKAIHHLSNSRRLGMRKTLVFYTGRAPHGQKTEWIMHEYRLDDEHSDPIQEDGWVVCRVFKKKNNTRGYHPEFDQEAFNSNAPINPPNDHNGGSILNQKQHKSDDQVQNNYHFDHRMSNSINLHQLLGPESTIPSSYMFPIPLSNTSEMQSSQNQLKLITQNSVGCSGNNAGLGQTQKYSGDWSILDKLLAMNQINKGHQLSQVLSPGYDHGFEPDFPRYSK